MMEHPPDKFTLSPLVISKRLHRFYVVPITMKDCKHSFTQVNFGISL